VSAPWRRARDLFWLGTRAGVFRISQRFLEHLGDPRPTVYHFLPIVSGFAINRLQEAPDDHILMFNSKGLLEPDGAHTVDPPRGLRCNWGLGPVRCFKCFPIGRAPRGFLPREACFGARYLRGWWLFRDRGNALEAMPTEVKGRVLFADRDGDLWIGTNGDGFVHIQHGPVHMFTTADGALCASGGGTESRDAG
jgi:hypothetical protein